MVDAINYNSITFEFEDYINKNIISTNKSQSNDETPYIKSDPRHRIIVCQHWLLGLCQVGNDCTYLHKLDKSKMPQCKHGKTCKIKNCPLKHGDVDVLECIFYRQGFCFNGPLCHRRHVLYPPEQCPNEPSYEPGYYISAASGNAASQLTGNKRAKLNQPNENYKVTLCTHWLQTNKCIFEDGCHFAHGEAEVYDSTSILNNNADLQLETEVYDPTRLVLNPVTNFPFTQLDKINYYLAFSPDLRSLSIAKRCGKWAVPHWMREEINNSFATCKYVILFFVVKPLRGIYGIARVTSEVLSPMIGSNITREFSIEWLRTIRISMRSISQMKISITGVFVGKSNYDCKIDVRLGLDLLYIGYRKPEWDWTLEIDKASYTSTTPHPIVNLHSDVLFFDDWIAKQSSYQPMYPTNRSTNKPTSYPSRETNDYYTGDKCGFVFCCNTIVVEEMIARNLLALPPDMKDVTISPDSPLFLLDMNKKCLIGVYQAVSSVTIYENYDPLAFTQSLGYGPLGKSPLPYQVPVQLVTPYYEVYLYDKEFVMMFGKTHLGGELPLHETKQLVNLIATRTGLFNYHNTANQSQLPAYRDRGGTNNYFYHPPFKLVDVVKIDINADHFEVKRKILGQNAANILSLIDSIGGSKSTIRVRIRGIGSGFYEGPNQQELNEPMHFNVSSDNEELLKKMIEVLNIHINKVKNELERH